MSGDNWSFARTDKTGRVVEVAEKLRISDYASTGLYYFSSGREFVSVAAEVISNGEKTKGEYYVIPVYQKYIQRGLDVRTSAASELWDMGTAEGLAAFERHLVAESIQTR
jgi:dTDP-glucose pyrophosphorylase